MAEYPRQKTIYPAYGGSDAAATDANNDLGINLIYRTMVAAAADPDTGRLLRRAWAARTVAGNVAAAMMDAGSGGLSELVRQRRAGVQTGTHPTWEQEAGTWYWLTKEAPPEVAKMLIPLHPWARIGRGA